MRLVFQKKSVMRVDLVDAKTKRPVFSLQNHAATFGTRVVLSRCSQNNDGDEGDDEIGETTIHDFASDKISVSGVKRVAKKWLHQDGYVPDPSRTRLRLIVMKIAMEVCSIERHTVYVDTCRERLPRKGAYRHHQLRLLRLLAQLQGPEGSSKTARLHTHSTDAAKAYLDVDVPEQDQDEVLISCIYLRLREADLTDTADGTTCKFSLWTSCTSANK